eukprot:TRINITY_DN27596_c0_g1_i2.p1 TRINITY_DN27596_c0_g1~~TRINITY_DN27596_c0_g1_i2.p1  ORF type:complete len:366 (-),score=132.29 TRINITY_DN27596_c0_g1_i2:652-1749(-)
MGKGGGKRKGGKGKSKGSKKRKRAEHDDGDEERSAGKGKGKGEKAKARAAAKAAAEAAALAAEQAAEEERKRAAARRAKPGFGKLLETFGVAAESDDDDDDEDESDEDAADEGQEEDQAGGDGLAGEPGMLVGEEGEEEEELEGDDVIEEDEEGDEEEAMEAESEANASGLEFYSRFWDDPPQALAVSKEDAETRAGVQRFVLPGGLSRCEAHGFDATALLHELLENPKGSQGGSSSSGSSGRSSTKLQSKEAYSLLAGVWRRCRLAPGLVEAFETLLAALNEGTAEGQDGYLEIGPGEGALFLYLHAYRDVSFPQHTHLNARAVRAMCALHIADHLLKAKYVPVPGQAEPFGDSPPVPKLRFTL